MDERKVLLRPIAEYAPVLILYGCSPSERAPPLPLPLPC